MAKKKYIVQRSPFIVPTTDGKYIAEHFGLVTSGNKNLSIAHMVAPPGWGEPNQTPEFDEFTLVIRGKKQIEVDGQPVILQAGHSIKVEKGVTVRYSNPFDEECEYVAICTPAFSIENANRENPRL